MRCKKLPLIVLAVGLLLGCTSTPAVAEMVEIQFTGLDLAFGGGEIYDGGGADVRTGDSTDRDELTSVQFMVDGMLAYSITDDAVNDISADVLIHDVPDLPVTPGFLQSGGAGGGNVFDLFFDGFNLQLNANDFTVIYHGNEIALSVSGTVDMIEGQALPPGLEILDSPSDDISVSVIVTNLSDFVYFEDPPGTRVAVQAFTGSGTGSVVGAVIPEPSTLAMIAGGLMGLLLYVRRRRS